jgi:hypothetical protein
VDIAPVDTLCCGSSLGLVVLHRESAATAAAAPDCHGFHTKLDRDDAG